MIAVAPPPDRPAQGTVAALPVSVKIALFLARFRAAVAPKPQATPVTHMQPADTTLPLGVLPKVYHEIQRCS